MKINDVKPHIETSGGMEEQLFSIQDTGMIFDILRNKMYSDPIRAICREISSNARDAHREVGKESVPCEITLPSTFSSFYKIKDFGPGISPDRIANVFIKYTGSTKRDDNTQTGGFGLGAKTPFSYNDEFAITTVVDGKRYSYSCFIDETKVGKIVCMNIQDSDEENSTEISIPVKNADFRKFIEDTEFVTRHWTVRPVIKGAKITYKEITPSLKGNGYSIVKSKDYYADHGVKLIIDGIEYPLDSVQLKTFTSSTKILELVSGTVYLYFGVGELSLSATREAVHLDKPTKDKISNLLKVIIDDMKTDVMKQLEAHPTLWEATTWYHRELRSTFPNPRLLGDLTWKSKTIRDDFYIKEAVIWVFEKGKKVKKVFDPNKISRTTHSYINFVSNAKIYLCDLALKDVYVKNVSKAFEDDPKLKYVYVVQPLSTGTDTIDDIAKKYDLEDYGAEKLSTITKVGKSYTTSGIRMLVFQFSKTGEAFKQVSYASMEEDKNKKIICSLGRDRWSGVRQVILKNKTELETNFVRALLDQDADYSIYGVDSDIPTDKIEEHFDDFIPIDDYIDEVLKRNNFSNIVELKYLTTCRYKLQRSLEPLREIKHKIKDPNSPCLKLLALQDKITAALKDSRGMISIYEKIKGEINDSVTEAWAVANPTSNFELLQTEYITKYPLLAHLDYYYAQTVLEPIVHYINVIDKE